MCNRKLILSMGGTLLATLLSSMSYAAQECRFGDGGVYNEMITGATLTSVSSIHWTPAISSGYVEIARATATLSPQLTSDCSMGNDGRSMWGEANSAFSSYGSVTVDGQSAQLYPTTVNGIFFAVALQTTSGGDIVYIPPQYGSAQKLNQMDDTSEDGATWKAIIVIFQGNTNQFTGNTGNATEVSPLENMTMGSMGLGNPSGGSSSNNKLSSFSVGLSSFHFPITPSTCQAIAVSGGDTANSVSFGNLNKTDVENNKLPSSRDFSINLTGCSNIYRIVPKVTATTTLTSGSRVLMENQLTSNAASGIGVHLLIGSDSNSFWEVVNQPEPTSYAYEYSASTADNHAYTIPFRATLMKDGKTIKGGSFSSTATIMFTYQ